MEHGAAMKGRVARTLGAACLVTFLTVPAAWAGIQPTPFRTGLFGVTVGQAIRISVLNAADTRGIIEPCARVVDAAGNLLVKMDAGPVPAGAGAFFDFDPLPPGPASVPGDRAQVRVEVEIVPAAFPPDPVATPRAPRGAFHLTLEVFDTSTGQTVFTMPFATVAGINPQPFATVAGIQPEPFAPIAGVEPTPFRTGLFGLVEGQSIRASVLNAGDAGGTINPCFHVFDLDGTLLFEMEAGALPAGAGGFVDFNPLPPGPTRAPGHRAQVRVEVELVPAAFPPDPIATPRARSSDFHLTLEVFDTTTGQTVYTVPLAAVAFNPQPEPPEPIH